MIERLEELLVVREAARVVHHHRLAHRQRQQKHRERRGEHAGPAEIDVVGVGLVARSKAAARVGREENRADREGGEERRFCGISVFHYIFLLQKIFRLSGGTKKSFRPSCSVQKRRKDSTFRGTTLLRPQRDALIGTPSCPSPVTGAPVRAYLVRRGCCYSEFPGSAVLMPRTSRHFSESASPATTLRHRISSVKKNNKRTINCQGKFY